MEQTGKQTGERTGSNTDERRFAPDTSSIGAARRFVRERVRRSLGRRDVRPDLIGDVELVVSELVTNAVEYGFSEPVIVRVVAEPSALVVSVGSARSAAGIADPSTWAGPVPAMRTGRGLAIVRAVTDHVSVEADGSTMTVHCTFRLV